jgi:UDP-N-acetylglucosamine--N-acetylmuramyl-(pentapeptide) pyrophosphoryl-undecaprenol N-acetylglucosamine transferase
MIKIMPKKKTILLTAGGTGGHFFPALALAEEFNTHKDLDVRLVTDERCRKYLTDEVKVKSHIIDLYLGSGSRIKSGTSFLSSIIKALLFVIKTKPSVIIGFGGYPSFPLMFVGQLLGIPTIIYEQNSFLGKSNKFFAKKAKIIALAYEITKNLPMDLLAGAVDDFGGGNPKTIFVGDFVRENIKELSSSRGETKSRRGDLVTRGRANYSEIATPLTGASNDGGGTSGALHDGLADNVFNLLIIGGSQGASIFSELIPNAVSILLSKHPKIKLNITQQVAASDQERVRKIYDELGVKNYIADFFMIFINITRVAI